MVGEFLKSMDAIEHELAKRGVAEFTKTFPEPSYFHVFESDGSYRGKQKLSFRIVDVCRGQYRVIIRNEIGRGFNFEMYSFVSNKQLKECIPELIGLVGKIERHLLILEARVEKLEKLNNIRR